MIHSKEFVDALAAYRSACEDLYDAARYELRRLVRNHHPHVSAVVFHSVDGALHEVELQGSAPGPGLYLSERDDLWVLMKECWDALCDVVGDSVDELDLAEE